MFIFKRPPTLPRSRRPLVRITETLSTGTGSDGEVANPECNALVLDARSASKLADLDWLFHAAQKHSNSHAFRKPGGRVVVMRSCPDRHQDPEAVAVSESIVGFAKSLAKENGSRGATVNLVRDAVPENAGAAEAPLDWLLSHHSCYVTGQELEVAAAPKKRQSSGAVLITGVAGGIGKATAEFLCEDDSEADTSSKLLLLDHPSTESKLQSIRNDLGKAGRAVDVLPLDLTAPDAGDIVSQAGIDLGGFQRVIHAAGITRDKTLRNMSYEKAWLPVMDVNLRSAVEVDEKLHSTGAALCDGQASFVYFSSTSGISGNAGQSNYATSKAALLGYAKAMSGAHPQCTFHVVSPGFIETDMTQKMPLLVRFVAAKLNALGQGGKPEDVAAAVAFLSSPDATGLAPGFHLRVCGLFMGGR